MLTGIYIARRFLTRGATQEKREVKIATAATVLGIISRVAVMTVVNYVTLRYAYPVGFSMLEIDILGFLPLAALFNGTLGPLHSTHWRIHIWSRQKTTKTAKLNPKIPKRKQGSSYEDLASLHVVHRQYCGREEVVVCFVEAAVSPCENLQVHCLRLKNISKERTITAGKSTCVKKD